jgi:hypothetical protein
MRAYLRSTTILLLVLAASTSAFGQTSPPASAPTGTPQAEPTAPQAAPPAEPAPAAEPPYPSGPQQPYAAQPPPPNAGYSPPPPSSNESDPRPPGEERERHANNALYVELLGAGPFYSFNYDRAIGDIAVRAGISYIGLSARSGDSEARASFLTIPLTLSYIGLGTKKHMFELGAGATILHVSGGTDAFFFDEEGSATGVIGHAVLGYRLQPPEGGFFLRAGLTPLFGRGIFVPWPHVGLGATF